MTPERIHPSPPPENSPETSPETSSFIPKPSPPPGDYYIQVPKDQIYRLPPPQNAALFASYTRRSKKSPRRHCYRLLCVLLAVVLALAVAAGVLYLVFRPRLPSYSLTSLSAASFNLSSTKAMSPQFDASIRADNPNQKIGYYYRNGGDISVSYNGLELGSGSWPVFFQEERNVTVFKSKVVGSNVLLSDEERRSMAGDVANGGVLLDVNFRVPVRVKFGAVTTWTMTVKVGCDVTVSDLKSNSKIVSQNCKVKFRVI